MLTAGIGGGWWWTDLQARRAAHQLADGATQAWGISPDGIPRKSGVHVPNGIGGPVIAVVRAPRLGKSWRMPVQSGTGTDILRQGLGMYDGSVRPGAKGNVGIAGHRTTWGAPFKHINEFRVGDIITVWTADGRFDYSVVSQGVTLPTDTSVIEQKTARGKAMLTLTTCHPEFSARERLYVHAVLIRKTESRKTGSVADPDPELQRQTRPQADQVRRL